MSAFKSHYDVIVIGAALAGLSSAIELRKHGLAVLVLEQHNLPGGVATSFVRGGVELEASLHEMLSIGTPECPRRIRRYFDELGCDIKWIRVPHAFRYVSKNVDANIRSGTHGDYEIPSRDIAEAVGDSDGSLYASLMEFFSLCHRIYVSGDVLGLTKMSKLRMFLKHHAYVTTTGYSCKEVFEAFHFPPKVIEILSAYWVYMGSPIEDLPFSMYGYMIAGYLGYGAYIPAGTSFEMAAKLERAASKRGTQIEYRQRVEKILVEKGKVQGVILKDGTTIYSDYVISGAYPNQVYRSMISPLSEVPESAKKWVNGMEIGVSVFSLILLLDATPAELGIKDYATFYAADEVDTSAQFEASKTQDNWTYLTSVCPNIAHKEASPEGTCIYSITYLPTPEAFKNLDLKDYEELKYRQAERFITLESKRLGVDLKSHILESVIETPLTISHYTSAYHGAIYGYRHTMENHVAARTMMADKEHFIEGLEFAGAHGISGDGMAPAIDNGIAAAKNIIRLHQKRRKA